MIATLVKTTNAYLIHRFLWRDSSYIARFLTPGGLVSVILKGARRDKSPFKAGLQYFTPLQVSYQGRTNLKTAVALDTLQQPRMLEYVQQACGLYVNELVLALVPPDGESSVYPVYHRFIMTLPESLGAALQWNLRHFERDLLDIAGYGLSIPPIQDARQYTHLRYHTGNGLCWCRATEQGAVDACVLRDFLTAKSQSNQHLGVLKSLMRQCLDDILGEKTLRSRELLKPWRAQRNPSP